jgi:negative regulator of genetic competence, sporulation and motility
MEMIMVSDRKLKVMLSGADLRDFGLNTEELDYTNTETKRMLWELLHRAKKSVGFNTEGHRVLVQLFPCRHGGCEIFITKSEESAIRDDCEPQLHYKPSHYDLHTDGRDEAFRFESLEHLLAVCHRLLEIGFVGKSEAYSGDDHLYYLLLKGINRSEYLLLDEFSFIEEYGTPASAEAVGHFLGEHGHTLCEEDAIRILGVL